MGSVQIDITSSYVLHNIQRANIFTRLSYTRYRRLNFCMLFESWAVLKSISAIGVISAPPQGRQPPWADVKLLFRAYNEQTVN